MEEYYNRSEEEILRAIADGSATDILGMGEAFIRMQTEGFCKTLLVSNGLTEKDAQLLGFEKVDTLESALIRARELVGPNATIGIIPQGGEVLCRERSLPHF